MTLPLVEAVPGAGSRAGVSEAPTPSGAAPTGDCDRSALAGAPRAGAASTSGSLIECATREAWLAARRNLITASDAAAILGCSPWGSALSVYAEKVGASEGLADNALFRRGRRMEPVVLQEYREATGRWARAMGGLAISVHAEYPWLGATLDAETGFVPWQASFLAAALLGESRPVNVGPLELKTGGEREDWEGDRAPVQYEVQLQLQMAVTGAERGTLACLLGLRDEAPVVRDRDRDDAFLATAIPVLRQFWRHVERREPPDPRGWPSELAAAKKLWRGPGDGNTVALSDEHAAELVALERAKAEERAASQRADEAEARLWLALGDAQFGALPDGTFVRGRVFKDGKRVLDRWVPRFRRGR